MACPAKSTVAVTFSLRNTVYNSTQRAPGIQNIRRGLEQQLIRLERPSPALVATTLAIWAVACALMIARMLVYGPVPGPDPPMTLCAVIALLCPVGLIFCGGQYLILCASIERPFWERAALAVVLSLAASAIVALVGQAMLAATRTAGIPLHTFALGWTFSATFLVWVFLTWSVAFFALSADTRLEAMRLSNVRSPRAAAEIWVSQGRSRVRLPIGKIEWAQAERDYVNLHTGERAYLIKESITRLQTRLDPAEFARVHRSAIIRLSAVTGVERRSEDKLQVVMASGARVPVSRSYAHVVRALVGRTDKPICQSGTDAQDGAQGSIA